MKNEIREANPMRYIVSEGHDGLKPCVDVYELQNGMWVHDSTEQFDNCETAQRYANECRGIIEYDPDEMLERAIQLWMCEAGREMPSRIDSEVDIATNQVHLGNVNGTLAIYQITEDANLILAEYRA